MKIVLAIAALFGIAGAFPFSHSRTEIEKEFEVWMSRFELAIEDSAEYLYRLGVFADNMKKVETHNAGNHTWTMALNQFAHLTANEFTAQHTGLKVPEVDSTIPRVSFELVADFAAETPKSFDWVDNGAVTAVKNQGSCGSCWSFSTTGGLEGAYYVKNKKLVSFSEQQLVSCDKTDAGCNGGLMDNAFSWVKENGGLCSEDDYPYTSAGGRAASCKSSCSIVEGSAVTGYVDVSTKPQVTPCSVKTMEKAVAQQPVSVAIEADQSSFQFYSSGVMTGECGTSLDHGVLVVGYGSEDGTDYWKIKNSWGASWGVDGYIKIEKGNEQKGGKCGVLLAASYPLL